MAAIVGTFHNFQDEVICFRCPSCHRLSKKPLRDMKLYTPNEGLTHWHLTKVSNRYVLDGVGCSECEIMAPIFITLTAKEAKQLITPPSNTS